MALHSIPFSGGALTRPLDAGLASASTILFETLFRGKIVSHSPNTLVLTRCMVCRNAPLMGWQWGCYQRACEYNILVPVSRMRAHPLFEELPCGRACDGHKGDAFTLFS